ncbi:unnamed protein product [Heligmosomoides polygyrus]|uniref:Acyl-CoA_ox_N domain-containing protein n=1 Tax=Heligmosomoides polygyrus TaxID=6339 RepID=A0A183GSN5_HELPZ|nr:unnamed protein product [Heligmosomoides polygyrus]
MPLNKLLRAGDHEDLAEERQKATFDTDEMAAIIWESKEILHRRREITKKVEQHTELHDPYSQSFMSRGEAMENAARKVTKMVSELDELEVNPMDANDMYHLVNEVIGISGHPLALHGIMFVPTLQAQCSDEQMHWLERAVSREIIGTYAQTELGHDIAFVKTMHDAGTNLKKLETTATYDAKTQEFVLHSPTRTSMKW